MVNSCSRIDLNDRIQNARESRSISRYISRTRRRVFDLLDLKNTRLRKWICEFKKAQIIKWNVLSEKLATAVDIILSWAEKWFNTLDKNFALNHVKKYRYSSSRPDFDIEPKDLELLCEDENIWTLIEFVDLYSLSSSRHWTVNKIIDVIDFKTRKVIKDFLWDNPSKDTLKFINSATYHTYSTQMKEALSVLDKDTADMKVNLLYDELKVHWINGKKKRLVTDFTNYIPYIKTETLEKFKSEQTKYIKKNFKEFSDLMKFNDLSLLICLGNQDKENLDYIYRNYTSWSIMFYDIKDNEDFKSFIKSNIDHFKPLDKKLALKCINDWNYHAILSNLYLLDNKLVADTLIKFSQYRYLANLLPQLKNLDIDVAWKLIENRSIYEVMVNLSSFNFDDWRAFIDRIFEMRNHRELAQFASNLNPKHHLYLADKLIETGNSQYLLDNLQNFKSLDLEYIYNEILIKDRAYKLADKLDLFPFADKSNLANILIESRHFDSVLSNIDKFEWVDIKSLQKMLESFDEFALLWKYIHLFDNIDASIAYKIIKYIRPSIVVKYHDRFLDLDPKIKSFSNKLKNRKNDLLILDNLPRISRIANFDALFSHFIENRQKSIISTLQKLSIALDLDIFKSIFKSLEFFDLRNLSWLDDDQIKSKLKYSFNMLLSHTPHQSNPKLEKEFSRFLSVNKTMNINALNDLIRFYIDPLIRYIDTIIDKKLKSFVWKDLDISKCKNMFEIFAKPEFLEAFKMYKKTTKNKNVFKRILQDYINWDESLIYEDQKNLEWKETIIKKTNYNKFLKKNLRYFDTEKDSWSIDYTSDIAHFTENANLILEKFSLARIDNHIDLLQYFDLHISKNKNEINANSNLDFVQFLDLFADLELQIKSLRDVLELSVAKKISRLYIYREAKPLRTLMMWNWVDWSCLSFYSWVWNFFSAATNAADINKSVFYLENENREVVWRVLVTVDDDWKIVRFPLYKKWKVNIDLNKYFDHYLKTIASESSLELNWNIDKVSLLIWNEWYKDPVYRMVTW